jgi:ATP-dependent helicase/nuclease subunit A
MTPPDHAARLAVRSDIAESAFVEAGAGSGKTACMVDRFVALVESGVDADAIAAITFTEKAAAELVDRIRRALQAAAAGSGRAAAALDVVDRAAITTLHGFAQRLLSEHPLEAGLPPRIEVLDEIVSDLRFQERWEGWLGDLLDDPDAARLLGLVFASGARIDHVRQVAVAFNDNWDLVAERRSLRPTHVPLLDIGPLLDGLRDLRHTAEACSDPDDKLSARLGELGEWGRRLTAAPDDERRLELLGRKPSCKVGNSGRAGNWPPGSIGTVRGAVSDFGARVEDVRTGVQQRCLEQLAEHLAAFTVEGAARRRAEGELEFHDLLVLARNLLRDPDRGWSVRRAAAARYQRLLIDEFQDTDPIQVEIAVLLASDDPGAGSRRWHDVEVAPGRLCLVGDPKQSIYRFRRADIGVFLKSRDSIGGTVHHLTTNFRSTGPVVEWVNATFSELITGGVDQPDYVALHAVRPAAPTGPAVTYLGAAAHPATMRADELRQAEADDVAGAVSTVIAEGWAVGEGEGWRAARWSDVAILLPARTSLRMLERALGDAGVPYRVETSSLVYATTEVRELLIVARAIDDPTDDLAVVAALRTSAFGCGDDDLYRWRQRWHGRWDHQAPLPSDAPADDPVTDGIRWLGDTHRQRSWRTPSETLTTIVEGRRLLEVATVYPRPRDLWRRIRFVLDQCRAWEEAGGDSLRDYLDWVALQSAEGARVIETVLPETDDAAVRILTVHGAKGLEFPVTVMSGMTTKLVTPSRGVEVRFPPDGRWAIKLLGGLATAEWELTRPLDEQLDRAERLRLLYVAATRAADHLVVSMHRKEPRREGQDPDDTAAQVLFDAGSAVAGAAPLVFAPAPNDSAPTDSALGTLGTGSPGSLGIAAVAVGGPDETVAEWQARRTATLAAAARPLVVSATRLAEETARALADEELDGVRKGARDLDLPPWQKGRYGSAVGRAVHGVLQAADLVFRDGLAEACVAQAVAEGVTGRDDVIEGFVRSALDSEVVKEAAAAVHWRELYVGAPRGDGTVLEGYIDLLFRRAGGLVIVDYKTDRWDSNEALQAKVDKYRVQIDAYREAVVTATGETVVDAVLLFLSASGDAVAVSV